MVQYRFKYSSLQVLQLLLGSILFLLAVFIDVARVTERHCVIILLTNYI